MKINPNSLSDMVWYAFRYSLGRRTHAVQTVSQVILDNWDNLKTQEKQQFQKEIRATKDLGDKSNIESWHKILEKNV